MSLPAGHFVCMPRPHGRNRPPTSTEHRPVLALDDVTGTKVHARFEFTRAGGLDIRFSAEKDPADN
ncbi:hypothetical protein [Streptomyces sp. NPDC053427]|uniref:hypothetical protein n=1 Tax=Streptomyces sp. NPDC053427 TaxID=3365701 RepID=UPI0037D31CBD